MPNISDYREAHYMNTGKVSDNVRALSIAAIGIIWIFKKQNPNGDYQIPEALYLPVLLVFIAMALDIMQYIYGSISWGIYFRLKEKEGIKDDKEIYAPPSINSPTYLFFYGKIVVIGFSYFYIINFLMNTVKWV